MNKQYRIIWNQALGMFTVASELAKGKVKSSSSASASSKKALLTSGVMAAALLSAGSAFAASPNNGFNASGVGTPYDLKDTDYNATAAGAFGLLAEDGGVINTSNVNVTTSGASGYGVYSARKDSAISMTGGSITTTGSGAYALVAADGGSFKGTGLNINSSSYGAYSARGSSLELNNTSITTNGTPAYGAYVNGAGSTLTFNGGSVLAQGSGSYGLVSGNSGVLNASDLTVQASSLGLYANAATINGDKLAITANTNWGVKSYQKTGVINLTNSTIDVTGSSNYAFAATDGALITGDNVNLTLHSGAYGFALQSASRGEYNNSSVTSTEGGAAVRVESASQLKASGLNVKVSDQDKVGASGAALSAGSAYFGSVGTYTNSLDVADSTLNASGANVYGLEATSVTNNVSLKNSTLTASDTAIYAHNRTSLTVNAEHAVISGKTLLNSGSNAEDAAHSVQEVTLNTTNQSQLQGDVTINRDRTLNSSVNLDQNTLWTGASAGLQSLSLKNGSQWNVTNSSDVDSITLDNSTISMTAPATGYSMLNVGNLTSNNGTIEFKTHLMDDSSQTDQLHVTGDYNGTTNVMVTNAGGTGAQTLQGINLIQVDGQANGDFVQQGRIVAGAYDYKLQKVAGSTGTEWVLNSDLTPVVPPKGGDNGTGDGGNGDSGNGGDSGANNGSGQILPPAPMKMTYRPEGAAYAANLAAANTLFSTSMADRTAQTTIIDPVTGAKENSSLWLRNEGGHSRSHDGSGQLSTQSNRYVVQLGGDVAQWSASGSDRFHLGVMGGYANAQSNTHSSVSGYQAKGQVNGYSAGLYGGWQQNAAEQTGAYVESWALYNWFDNSVQGQNIGEESYKSHGITASVEGGYSFHVADLNAREGVYVQPKAQLNWMGVQADSHRERNGSLVSGEGNNNLQSRVGVRTYLKGHSALDDNTGRTFEPFVEANWVHNTEQYGSNLNGVRVQQAGTRDMGELKLGVDAKVSGNVGLWGSVGQQMGSKGYSDTSAVLGVKVSF